MQVDAPDWAQVEQSVSCPLCEYQLRGLSDPRCPECGYRFAWPELLDPTLRRHEYLFEHHPRHKIWSFWKTLIGGLEPRRFWRSVYPTQPSHPGWLIVYWLLASSVLLVSAVGPGAFNAVQTIQWTLTERANYTRSLNADQSPRGQINRQYLIRGYGSVQAYVAKQYPMPTAKDLFQQAWRATRDAGVLFLTILIWPWLTILTLMLFRISMRRARIRKVHVLRCVLYSFDGIFWIGLFTILVMLAIIIPPLFDMNMTSPWLSLLWLVYPAITIFMMYRLVIAYKYYLRFDWPAATVVASQVIVILLAAVLLLQIYNARMSLSL